MKIVKSCLKQQEATIPTPKTLIEVPIGTIFRYNELSCGPYLRIKQGTVDLNLNKYYTDGGTVVIFRYVPLSNAYLVTGEE